MDRTYSSDTSNSLVVILCELMSALREAFNRLEDSDNDAISEYLAEHSKKNSKSSTAKIKREITTVGSQMKARAASKQQPTN